jgi:hypothetical protein
MTTFENRSGVATSSTSAPRAQSRASMVEWSRMSRSLAASLICGVLAAACGGSSSTATTSGTGGHVTGVGGANTGGGGMSGAGGVTGAGGNGTPGSAGSAGNGTPGTAGNSSGGTGGAAGTIPIGGSTGVFSCTPGREELIITDCGYPNATNSPLSSTVFNENEVLRAIRPAGSWPNGIVQMFYNDEHALTLGVRQVGVKTSSGTSTTDFPVTPLATNPGSAIDPQLGTTMLNGVQSGLDASFRPMWPALFITDISNNPAEREGDWQMGGRPSAPNAIFGSWKAAVRTVDMTKNPAVTTITPDADPAKNNWNLAGGDPVPAGLANEGFGAEARWNVTLTPGHSYRLQVLVHDGDQNKAGGDSGEACVLFCAGGGGCGSDGCPTTGTGGTGGNQCPEAVTICGPGGIPPASCPAGTLCANGCCLSSDG